MAPTVLEMSDFGIRFRLSRFHGTAIRSLQRRFIKAARRNAEEKGGREFWAIRHVSFRVLKGEAVGVIGRNGAGKTTLLRGIAGIYLPDEGRRVVQGTTGLLQIGVGFHHDLTGRDNVYISAALLGMDRDEIDRLFPGIVEFSGLGEFIDLPLSTYSSGMAARLGFSVSMHLTPDILLVDEAFSVGDEDFKIRGKQKIDEFLEGGGTLIFVSHNMQEVRRLCSRTLLLQDGRIVFDGPTEEAEHLYHERLRSKKAQGRPLRKTREVSPGDICHEDTAPPLRE